MHAPQKLLDTYNNRNPLLDLPDLTELLILNERLKAD